MTGRVPVGVLDLGTNAVRLRLALVESGLRPATVAEEREPIRLGEGLFLTGRLGPEAMDRAVGAVDRLARRARSFGVEAFRAVATAAVREGRNGPALVARIARETGVVLEVLSGHEEARLAALGVLADPGLPGRDLLVCDLGGGSTEFCRVGSGVAGRCWTLPLGTARHAERYLREDPPSPSALTRLGADARGALAAVGPTPLPGGVELVACGGTVGAIADLLAHRRSSAGGIRRAELGGLLDEVARLPIAERRRLPGMDPLRADVVVAGAALLREVLDHLGVDRVHPTRCGLRDGLVAELADGLR